MGKKTEFGALPIVILLWGTLIGMFLALALSAWSWFLLVATLVVLAAAVALTLAERRRRLPVAPAPVVARPADDASYRVLLVVDDGCSVDTLRDGLARHEGREIGAFVVAPALGSQLARWTGDEGAYAGAEEHLDATLKALAELGVEAHGKIGPHDPIQAIDDGLREFPPDEIFLAVHADGSANWLEAGVVERARDRYDVPVRHLVV